MSHAAISSLESQLSSASHELELATFLNKGILQTNTEYKLRIAELEAENAILRRAEGRLAETEDRLEKAEQQLEAGRDYIEDLQADRELLKNERVMLDAELERIERENKMWERRYWDSVEGLERLGKELRAAGERNGGSRKKIANKKTKALLSSTISAPPAPHQAYRATSLAGPPRSHTQPQPQAQSQPQPKAAPRHSTRPRRPPQTPPYAATAIERPAAVQQSERAVSNKRRRIADSPSDEEEEEDEKDLCQPEGGRSDQGEISRIGAYPESTPSRRVPFATRRRTPPSGSRQESSRGLAADLRVKDEPASSPRNVKVQDDSDDDPL